MNNNNQKKSVTKRGKPIVSESEVRRYLPQREKFTASELEAMDRNEKRRLKKKRKRVISGRGTRQDFVDLFGDSAKAFVEFRLDQGFLNDRKQFLYQLDIQSLVLWVLGEVVSPKWVFVKNKVLVEKIVLVVVDGLNEEIWHRWEHTSRLSAGRVPTLKSVLHFNHPTPFPLQVNSSLFDKWYAVNSLLQVTHKLASRAERVAVEKEKAQRKMQEAIERAKRKQLEKSDGHSKPIKQPEDGEEKKNDSNEDKKHKQKSDSDNNSNKPKKQQLDFKDPYRYVLGRTELFDNGYPLADVPELAVSQTTGKPFVVNPCRRRNNSNDSGSAPKRKLIAVDCEMCWTARGLELARVSLIDDKKQTILDEFVMPDVPITDYNTKYSGITADMMKDVTLTMEQARDKVMSLVDGDDILVGHSLENDLKAMHMIHMNVIDTALLYPHPRGPPMKSSLRYLASKYLNQEIQRGEASSAGHDSREDALAALNLTLLKIEKGPSFGAAKLSSVSLLDLLQLHKRAVTMVGDAEMLKRMARGHVSAVPSQGDDDTIAKMAPAARNPKLDLVIAHLHEFSHDVERIYANPSEAAAMDDEEDEQEESGHRNKRARLTASTSKATHTDEEQQQQRTQEEKDAEASANVQRFLCKPDPLLPIAQRQALRKLAARLQRVYEAVPTNTMLVVVSGQSSGAAVKM
eukprot:TRINITY_DN66226_c11_g2_i4.p1 TRINITY_DN66226_c11_g2~~TRINITY_DN66226_c11_g2_i4.p1  ORF type:complete len:773 (-),score=393.61 TRINITY_DN66226_c11_g2_i4:2165-4222(-)